MFLKAPDMYSAVHHASSLYYMKASLFLSSLSSKHQYRINKLYYTHMHTKTLFSKLIPEQEIKFSAYRCKTEAILTSLCSSEYLYEIMKKECINRHFVVHISKNDEHALTDDEVSKSLSGKLESSCFAWNFSHLSFPPLSGRITVFRRNTNQHIATGNWSACMGLLLDQIPKTFLPSPKLSLLCNLC